MKKRNFQRLEQIKAKATVATFQFRPIGEAALRSPTDVLAAGDRLAGLIDELQRTRARFVAEAARQGILP